MECKILKAKYVIAGAELAVKENAAIKMENGKITEIYDNAEQIPDVMKEIRG